MLGLLLAKIQTIDPDVIVVSFRDLLLKRFSRKHYCWIAKGIMDSVLGVTCDWVNPYS